jgi:glyoxylase-like metal-dependent hydrolase (beta-lactamase superfamily II)
MRFSLANKNAYLKFPLTLVSFVLVFALSGGKVFAIQFSPVPVGAGVYAFIGDTGLRTYENQGMNANAGFIVTKAGVVVVDSGSSYLIAKAMYAAIRQVTKLPVKYVINTGGQDHRWLGNGYFKEIGAQIIASSQALADMQERGASELEALKPELREKIAGTKVVYPERLVGKADTLTMSGTEIRILYFSGGHTPGDAVVWLPKLRILFSGDLIFVDRLLGVLPFSNTQNWLASFAEIEALKPKAIIPGHGKVCNLAKARRETKDYLSLLRTHMKKALDQGQELQSAIDTLDQRAFGYLQNYDLLKGGNASRVYLEMETE